MKLKMCRTQSVFALLTLCVGLVHSWDVAVSYEDELKFYTNKTLISTIRLEYKSITALAYDDVHNMILYVDKQPMGDAICGYTLTSVENNCFTERTGRNIHGIAYDSVTETVFFTDVTERTVNSFSLKPGSQNNARGNLLIKIDEGIPRDIIVDSCYRHIYWLTTDRTNPTIQRARLTGTEREVFQTINSIYVNATDQFEPHSLTIDPQTHYIYWIEPFNTTLYQAYYLSARNQTKKTGIFQTILVTKSVTTHPSNTFAVTNRLFYIVDFRPTGGKVYIFKKEFSAGVPLIAEIEHNFPKTLPIVGIVANYPITENNHDCEIY